MTTLHTRETIDAAVAVVRKECDLVPEVALILGTGLGGLAKEIDVATKISYSEVPSFPVSTVESHAGRLLFGTLGRK